MLSNRKKNKKTKKKKKKIENLHKKSFLDWKELDQKNHLTKTAKILFNAIFNFIFIDQFKFSLMTVFTKLQNSWPTTKFILIR